MVQEREQLGVWIAKTKRRRDRATWEHGEQRVSCDSPSRLVGLESHQYRLGPHPYYGGLPDVHVNVTLTAFRITVDQIQGRSDQVEVDEDGYQAC